MLINNRKNLITLQTFKWQFTAKRQQAFLEDLCALIADGVPASQAIDAIAQMSTGVTQTVAQNIAQRIAEGQLLAAGMEHWFARPLVEIVRVGESGGALLPTLQSAVKSFTKQTHALNLLIQALIYPIIVIVFALIIVVFVKNSVLQSFAEMRPVSQWPDVGQNLYNLALFIENGWWLIILLLCLSIFLIVKTLQHTTGKVRTVLDTLPFLSLYREFAAARLMEILGLLMINGVVLKEALSTLQREATPYLAWHLLHMQYRLSGGLENIADVLNTNLINSQDMIRLRIIAKGRGFAHALQSLGKQASERNVEKLTVMSKILAGLLLTVGALIAITIVVGIYTIGSSVAT